MANLLSSALRGKLALARSIPLARRHLNTSTSHPLSRLPLTASSPFPSSLSFAFDIDGVLAHSSTPLPHARETLSWLSGDNVWRRRIGFCLMTNGGGVVDKQRRSRLGKTLGVELSPNQLIQSHTPLRSSPLIASLKDKPVLIIGGEGEGCRLVGESYGLTQCYIPQDIIAWNPSIWPKTKLRDEERSFIRQAPFSTLPFSAILILHDSHDWGRDITLINELVSSNSGIFGTRDQKMDEAEEVEGWVDGRKMGEGGQIPVVFSNPDMEWQSDYPLPRYGQGAFKLACESIYTATTGLKLHSTQYGKPHKATYDFAQEMMDRHVEDIGESVVGKARESTYMIGDNPESDIAGANAHGWSSLLLRTGVYRGGEPTHQPTAICDDVGEAVSWAVRREVEKLQRVME